MWYMGSKAKIAKEILPIILKNRKEGQWYVEPFLGGANSMQYVDGNRLGGEYNEYVAALWQKLLEGWEPPESLTREEYKHIKDNKDLYDPWYVGYVGICWSYSGKWFGGYAGICKKKGGRVQNYARQSLNNVKRQLPKLAGLQVKHSSYEDLSIPDCSLIYCDPPYKGTTQYKERFDSTSFWQWCREMSKRGHKVFISEYDAPNDFKCIWERPVKVRLSAMNKTGKCNTNTEKLFTYAGEH